MAVICALEFGPTELNATKLLLAEVHYVCTVSFPPSSLENILQLTQCFWVLMM